MFFSLYQVQKYSKSRSRVCVFVLRSYDLVLRYTRTKRVFSFVYVHSDFFSNMNALEFSMNFFPAGIIFGIFMVQFVEICVKEPSLRIISFSFHSLIWFHCSRPSPKGETEGANSSLFTLHSSLFSVCKGTKNINAFPKIAKKLLHFNIRLHGILTF